jgi:hypothetical protein
MFISKNSYATISSTHFIGDFDVDGSPEMIFRFNKRVISIDCKEGALEWKIIFDDIASIESDLIDLDKDKKYEIIVYADHQMYMLNCEDGRQEWKFHVGNYNYFIFDGIEDIDQNGNPEIVVHDEVGLYVINPLTGNLLWNFTNGELVWDYNFYFDYNSAEKNNIIVIYNEKIYSISPKKLSISFNNYQSTVAPGDRVTFTFYIGYFDNPISGVEINAKDFELNGYFSTINELYPGFYEFNYIIPQTSESVIRLGIEVLYPGYFGDTSIIELNVLQDIASDESIYVSDFEKELFSIFATAIPDKLTPGESTTILFRLYSSQSISLANCNISLFDNNVYGTFSPLSWYSAYYMKFVYTVPNNVSIDTITILIMVSHGESIGGIGVVKLNITRGVNEIEESGFDPANSITEKDSGFNDVSITITQDPDLLSPGTKTVVIVKVNNGSKPIIDATILAFDNGLEGTISEIFNHGNGYYSFIYAVPSSLLEYITSTTIFVYATIENSMIFVNSTEISIIRPLEENEENNESSISLDIITIPSIMHSGETSTLIIELDDVPDYMTLFDVTVRVLDNGGPGELVLIDKYDDNRIVYEYSVPFFFDGPIEITAHVYYKGEELVQKSTILEVFPKQFEIDAGDNTDDKYQAKSSDEISMVINTIMLLTLFVGILIGTFGIYSYIYITKRKKGKQATVKIQDDNNSLKNGIKNISDRKDKENNDKENVVKNKDLELKLKK